MGDDYLFQGDGDDEFGSLAPARRRGGGGAPASPDGPSAYVFPLGHARRPRARREGGLAGLQVLAAADVATLRTQRLCRVAKPLRCAFAPPTASAPHVSARSRAAEDVPARIARDIAFKTKAT
jgi:hypothetical protein